MLARGLTTPPTPDEWPLETCFLLLLALQESAPRPVSVLWLPRFAMTHIGEPDGGETARNAQIPDYREAQMAHRAGGRGYRCAREWPAIASGCSAPSSTSGISWHGPGRDPDIRNRYDPLAVAFT